MRMLNIHFHDEIGKILKYPLIFVVVLFVSFLLLFF